MTTDTAQEGRGFRVIDFTKYQPPSNREMFAEQLELAAELIRSNRLDSAAWRVADAAGWLADKIIRDGLEDVVGVHCRTGMGALITPAMPGEPFREVGQRTALYRHFDASDRLLYVGISLSALERLKQHSYGAHWYRKIVRVDIQWHHSREAALKAEAQAIKTEKPAHNIALNS